MVYFRALLFVSLLLILSTTKASAGGIEALKLSPVTVYVGDEVTITVDAGSDPPAYCGMVLLYGDGSDHQKIKIGSNGSKFPVQIRRTFQKPGSFLIKATGQKITNHLHCLGSAEAQLTVIARPSQPKSPSMTSTSSAPSQETFSPIGNNSAPGTKVRPAPVGQPSRVKPKTGMQQPDRPVPQFAPVGGGASAADL